jgi:uncharacterized membrane protein YczE
MGDERPDGFKGARVPSGIRFRRFTLYAVGFSIAGLGIGGLLQAHLGTDPFDAVNAGIGAHIGLAVGQCSWINASLVLLLAWLLGRRPKIGTVALVFFLGLMIDVGVAVLPRVSGLPGRGVEAALSLAALYLGLTSFVLSGIGAGCLEELMLSLVAKGFRLHRARWGIEVVLLALALVLRGPINVVTVLFVALTGPVLSWSIPTLASLVRVPLPDHDPEIPLGDIR